MVAGNEDFAEHLDVDAARQEKERLEVQPEKVRTPEDAAAAIQRGVAEVDQHLHRTEQAYVAAAKHLDSSAETLVTEPAASELAQAEQELRQAEAELETLRQVLDGSAANDEVTELPTVKGPVREITSESPTEQAHPEKPTGELVDGVKAPDVNAAAAAEAVSAAEPVKPDTSATPDVAAAARTDGVKPPDEGIAAEAPTVTRVTVEEVPDEPEAGTAEKDEAALRAVEKVFGERTAKPGADKKPLDYRVGETIILGKHFSAAEKPQRDWTVKKAEAGQYLLEQTHPDGAKQFLVAEQSELELFGASKSRRKQLETKVPDLAGTEESGKPDFTDEELAWFAAGAAGTPEKPVDYSLLSNESLQGTLQSATARLNEIKNKVGKKDKSKQRITREDVNYAAWQHDTILGEVVKRAADDANVKKWLDNNGYSEAVAELKVKGEETKKDAEAGREKGPIRQPHLNRTVQERAMQRLHRESRANPDLQARLAESVGAQFAFDKDGTARLLNKDNKELAVLSPNQMNEIKDGVILKEVLGSRFMNDLLQQGISRKNDIEVSLGQLQQGLEIAKANNGDTKAIETQMSQLKEQLKQAGSWIDRVQHLEGTFAIVGGQLEYKANESDPPLRIGLPADQVEALMNHERMVTTLQTEKQQAMRQTIKEMLNSAPREFANDIYSGRFNFEVNDDATITVQLVEGDQAGSRYVLPAEVSMGVLSGKLPTGEKVERPKPDKSAAKSPDATSAADDDTAPAEDVPKPNAGQAPDAAKKAAEGKAEANPEKTVDLLGAASRAVLERIRGLAASEHQAEVKPLIESMARFSDDALGVRADNDGNIYVGQMNADHTTMGRVLEPRIERGSGAWTVLSTLVGMSELRKPENTIQAVENTPPTEVVPTQTPETTPAATTPQEKAASAEPNVHDQIQDLVRGFGTSIDAGEKQQLIELVGKLDANDRLPVVVEAIKDSSLNANVDDAMEVLSKSLEGEKLGLAAAEVMPRVYEAAGYDQAARVASLIGDAATRDKAMRELADLNQKAAEVKGQAA